MRRYSLTTTTLRALRLRGERDVAAAAVRRRLIAKRADGGAGRLKKERACVITFLPLVTSEQNA